jgi:cell division protein FtsL
VEHFKVNLLPNMQKLLHSFLFWVTMNLLNLGLSCLCVCVCASVHACAGFSMRLNILENGSFVRERIQVVQEVELM